MRKIIAHKFKHLFPLLIQEIIGTCKDLSEVFENYIKYSDNLTEEEKQWLSNGDEDEVFLSYLDEELFCCTQCGWWHEVGEGKTFEDERYCSSCIDDVR